MSMPDATRPRYSPARRIPLGTSGDLLFLSGILCADEDAHDNIEVQTRRIFGRIAAVLAKHGASLSDIMKTTSYLVDLADYDGFNRVRVEIFMDCKDPPASTAVGEDEGKIGDLELASQIREICNSVADSAEAVSVLYYGPSSVTKKRQIDRYERAKKRAEKKIEQISDELVRDTAIYQVLNFCMKARDVENAEALFHRIQTRMDNRACKKRASNVS